MAFEGRSPPAAVRERSKMELDSLPAVSGQRILGGRYVVGRKIAEGGMGAVHEATHLLSKKVVALKILAPQVGRDEATRSRFLREVAAPAQIGHDGIVEIYDAGFDGGEGVLFVAMELLAGVTLRDRLSRGGLSQRFVLDVFEEMLAALAAAHKAGIVHRDLKPENVFLQQRRDSREVVKILDFGIARDLGGSDTVTHAGTAMGTPHYMSPEQAMSARDVGFTADVWAVGVMLYEALTGAPPFVGDTIATLVVEVCTKPHRPLAQVAPSVPPAIASLVDRCLDKDPLRRPRDAAELASLLREARGGAAPQSPWSTPSSASTGSSGSSGSLDSLPLSGLSTSLPTMPATSLATAPPTSSPSAMPTPNLAPTPTAPRLSPPPIGSYAPASSGVVPATAMGDIRIPTPAPAPAPAPPRRGTNWIPIAIIGALGFLGALGIGTLAVGLWAYQTFANGGGGFGGPRTEELTGSLDFGDTFYGLGQFSDGYTYAWSAGDHVVIALDSNQFDTFLVLRTPSGREIVNDDDPVSGTLNSRIDTVLSESGTFQVVATSYAPGSLGSYRLTITSP
jgi:serine/threonine protein kinase